MPVQSQTDAESGDSYYTGYDQDAMEAGLASSGLYQTNLLNGIVGDAFRMKPGAEISPEEFMQYYQRLANSKYTKDAPASVQALLSDPRSVIRLEGGKLVYRPDMSTGDFKPVDYSPKSFGDMVKGFLSTPQMQIASMAAGGGGLGTLASMAGTLGSVATDNPAWGQLASLIGLGTGAYNALSPGDAVNSLGSSGVNQINGFDAANTPSTGSVSFDIPMGGGSYALDVGGLDDLLGGSDFSSSFNPTLTSGAAPAPQTVGPLSSLEDMASTLGSGGSVAVGGLPGVTDASLGLPSGGLAAALASQGITVPGALGPITLDANGNVVKTVAGGLAPGLSTTGTGDAPSSIPSTLKDAAGKVITNLATGAITNAIAGDGNPTGGTALTDAQAKLNAAAGRLPTEDEAASQAHADVTQAFQTQRDNYRRQLMGYGLDPSSGRYQGAIRKLQGQEAKTDALGQNLARRGVRSAALGEAATLANINSGLVNAQAALDAQNFARQQAVQNQVRQGLAPLVSAVAPGISKTVSNWFDLAKDGVSNFANSFDTSLV